MTRSQQIALAVLFVVAIWLASGIFRFGSNDEVQKKEKSLPRVKIERSVAEDRPVYLLSRGFSEADRSVNIRAEVSGRVSDIMADEGELVKEGQTLLKISLRDKQAKMDEAKAMLRQKQLEYDAAKKLNEKDFRSDTALAFSLAELNQAEAHVAAIQREIDDTVIIAPFSGTLEAREVEIGTFADVGDILCTIVDLDPLLAIINVSELEVQSLKVGQPARIRFTQGEERKGEITFISRKADENTRSFRVEISIENTDYKLGDGLSLEAGIPVNNARAHKVSPAILTLDTEGRIGVKTIDKADKVQFFPIKVVDSTSNNVWITGLPNEVTLIVTGQEFVTEQQKVTPVMETKNALPD